MKSVASQNSLLIEPGSSGNKDETQNESISSKESLGEMVTSCRYVMAYVGFFGMLLLYASRVNMGIAIVCMAKPINLSSNNTTHTRCAKPHVNTTESSQVTGDIDWDETTQGWILSSFFYGYLVTQIPGGYLSGRFGGKRVMLIGMVVYGLSTLAIPLAARYDGKNYMVSAWLVMILRVIGGLSTGVTFPAVQNLCGRWAPPYERSRIYVMITSGTMVGTVLMLATGGYFCEWTSFDGGWPSIFYIGGGSCILFCLVWVFLVYDSPADHPRISERERRYLTSVMEAVDDKKNQSVPWKQIMKSPAVWAIVGVAMCNNFGSYALLTELPTFMKEALNFDITENGVLSSLPYIATFIISHIVSNTIDFTRKKQWVSTRTCRKIAMLLATVVPAAFMAGIGNLPCGLEYVAVIFLVISVGFTGSSSSGFGTNPQDIAPRYAGEIYGIANTAGTIPGIVAPTLVSYLTKQGTDQEWNTVFYICAGVYIFGGVVFTLLARGEVQSWAM